MPRTTRVDVQRDAGFARPAAPIHDTSEGERASRKRRPAAAPCEMARDPPARRSSGVVFSDAKRVKVNHDAADVEMAVFGDAVKMSVNTGKERLKKRMAAELDALRDLVKKAGALSGGNKRFLAAEPRPEEAPSAKRMKMKKSIEVEEEIDICGGVVTPVVIRAASPRIPVEEASQICSRPSSTSRDKAASEKSRKTPPPVELIDAPRMSPKEGEIIILPEEDGEPVDMSMCRGGSPHAPVTSQARSSPSSTSRSSDSDTGSSSSSDSDDSVSSSSGGSDDESSSDSDSDAERVAGPAPAENNVSAQPAENVTSAPPQPETTESETWQRRKTPAPTVEVIHHAPSTSPEEGEVIVSPVNTSIRGASPRAPVSSQARNSPSSTSSTEPEKKVEGNDVPISVLLARAKEAYTVRHQQQRNAVCEREKARRAVREMEKAVRPDESISPRELEELGIVEYGCVLEELGLFLRPDV